MQERRHLPRTPILARAHIVTVRSRPLIPCTVRNLSEVSALVRLDEPLELPGALILLMNGTELIPCEVIRRAGRELAVTFAPRA